MTINYISPIIEPTSERYTEYLNSLTLISDIEVKEGIKDNSPETEVAWYFPEENRILIRPTTNTEYIETRIAHELTHASLINEGYRYFPVRPGDTLGELLNNILHHLILYPRLKTAGFNLGEDKELVNQTTNEKFFSAIKILYNSSDNDKKAYAILLPFSELIRLSPDAKEVYIKLLNDNVNSSCFDDLQNLRKIIEESRKDNSVEDYVEFKDIILAELNFTL